MTLTWDAVPEAVAYLWSTGVESGSSWTANGRVPTPTVSFRAPGIGATHWACVRSLDSAGNQSSEQSCERYIPAAQPPSVSSVVVSPPLISIPVGGDEQLTAVARDADGIVVSRTFQWSSTDTGVATVSSTGRVTAIAAGTATIHAATEDRTGSTTVQVTSAAPSTLGDTLFYDGFENGLGAWAEVSESLARIVTGSDVASSGSAALELTVPAGHTGTWLTRFFGPGRDSVFVRFKVWFPSDWTGNTKLLFVRGSRIDNLWSAWGTAGKCPDGASWFQTGNATYQSGNPGHLNFYTYFPDMARESNGTTCWGNFGDSTTRYEAMPPMAKEVWHTVEFWVKLNAPDGRDAVQQMWVNGRLRADWEGFRLRTTDNVRVNSITLHAYPDAVSSGARRLLYDDVLVTTRSPY